MDAVDVDGGWSIRDLAEIAGTTVRTIHYYIAEGLLPPPLGMKRNAVYSGAHVDRLRLIAALRDEGLALAAIRARLAQLSDAQVRSVVATLDEHLAGESDEGWTTLGLLEAAVTREVTTSEPPIPLASSMPSVPAQAASPPPPSSPSAPDAQVQAFARMSVRPGAEASRGPVSPIASPAMDASGTGQTRETAGDYLDRLLRRKAPAGPAPTPRPTPRPMPPVSPPPHPSRPDPYQSVRPVAWYHFQVDDGIELRVREDRFRESKGQLRSIVDSLRPILQRYGLATPEPNQPADSTESEHD